MARDSKPPLGADLPPEGDTGGSAAPDDAASRRSPTSRSDQTSDAGSSSTDANPGAEPDLTPGGAST